MNQVDHSSFIKGRRKSALISITHSRDITHRIKSYLLNVPSLCTLESEWPHTKEGPALPSRTLSLLASPEALYHCQS